MNQWRIYVSIISLVSSWKHASQAIKSADLNYTMDNHHMDHSTKTILDPPIQDDVALNSTTSVAEEEKSGLVLKIFEH